MINNIVIYLLFLILIIVLLGPLISRRIEKNLEIFFLIIGFLAALVSGAISYNLIKEAFLSPLIIHNVPIGIFEVVLIAGLIFEKYRYNLENIMESITKKIHGSILFAMLVFILGIGSSIISAILASVIIAEMASIIKIPSKIKNILLIISAYSIGLGASLLPIGEPLTTILIIKLSGEPYYANFFFAFFLLYDYVIPIILFLSIFAFYIWKKFEKNNLKDKYENLDFSNSNEKHEYKFAIERAIKIYIFVFALTLLGNSFNLIVNKYIIYLSPQLMYLFGSVSAFLDNATLTAAIISPNMSTVQIKSFIISLLISGGFLIPGNVPNIVIAYTHKINFRKWAKIALPIGLPIYAAIFLIIFIF
jgi:predicted cation transporter